MNLKNLAYALAAFVVTFLAALVVDAFVLNPQQTPSLVQPSQPFVQRVVPQYLSLGESLGEITAAKQKEWLYYLASPELDGRKPNTNGYRKAADYVEKHCKEWGLKTERQNVPNRGQNVFAYIEGADPARKDEVVVVGAHLDHLGNGRLGADDNGSGSVLVMALAKAFSKMAPPPRTIVFQWYTAEESGLIGSAYYTNNPTFPKGNPDISKHVAMINADMVGRLDRGAVAKQVFADLDVDLYQYVDDLNGKYSFARRITQRRAGGSDHTPFLRKRIPAVFIHTGTHRDYHRSSDTADKINYEGMEQISKYACELAYRCCHADELVYKTLAGYEKYAPTHDHGLVPFLDP
jgi:hypothetical protein